MHIYVALGGLNESSKIITLSNVEINGSSLIALRPGCMGVTKTPLDNFSVTEIFFFAKVSVNFF